MEIQTEIFTNEMMCNLGFVSRLYWERYVGRIGRVREAKIGHELVTIKHEW